MSLKLLAGIRPILLIAILVSLPVVLIYNLPGSNSPLTKSTNAAQVSVISSAVELETQPITAQADSGQITSSVTVLESTSAVLGASTNSTQSFYSELFPPQGITLQIEGNPMNMVTYHYTVEELVNELGIVVDENDIIMPSLDTPISPSTKVTYIKVEEKIEEQIEETPFAIEKKDDPEIEWGEEVVTQPGVTGKIIHSFKKVFHNAQHVGTIDMGKSEIPPVTQIVSKGLKIIEKVLTLEDGSEFKYCRVIRMKVTAYDASCLGCNNITALGYELKKGIVAVDPKVIPLKSTVYVPGYGVGFAADVGGAVKGNIIDVGFATPEERLSSWKGTKYDDVYVACPS